MRAEVRVQRSSTNSFADCFLHLEGRSAPVRLDVEYGPVLDACGRAPATAVDFLLIAAVVYGLDKLVPRDSAEDRWTRTFELTIPVADSAVWIETSDELEACLSFLTGDNWFLTFTQLNGNLIRPAQQRRSRLGSCRGVEAISLFSGGLDSLIGVIDWMESHDGRLLLVGHHDADVPGPNSDQQRLLLPLTLAFPRKVVRLFARVGISVGVKN